MFHIDFYQRSYKWSEIPVQRLLDGCSRRSPLVAAIALGAVVAPPDAVAATAIARKVRMPRRIVTIQEGESLLNDATALICLRAAIAGSVPVAGIAGDFLIVAGGGVVVRVAAAYVLTALRKRIRNVAINTSTSLVAPLVAYWPAEAIHASGVLAVVVTGLVMGTKAPSRLDGAARLSQRSNWNTVQFLLENSVFLLIGLQVRSIIDGVQNDSLGAGRIWAGCAIILLAVLLLRPVWVFPATYLPRLNPAVQRNDPAPPWQFAAIVTWAGMRGVVTLAAVLVLPADLEHRSVLILAALVVVGGTLTLQGFTLPPLVGMFRIQERGLAAWERLGRPSAETATPSERYARLRLAMLEAERANGLELRRGGEYAQEVLSDVLERLDIEESMLGRSTRRTRPARAAPKGSPGQAGCAATWSRPGPGRCPATTTARTAARKVDDGAPADVPAVREGGVLRFVPRHPCLQAF
ncbi:cation:proton antiporter [Pseudarthrobacter sp. TAF60_1]|uniref:cation:proton antiporter n=1 Tax=Pseudarthrobacter sp. TAF60_1 TaxID=3233071 RepID=UPI003F9E2012